MHEPLPNFETSLPGRNSTYTFSYLIYVVLYYYIVIFCVIEFE